MALQVVSQPNSNSIWSREQESSIIQTIEESADTTIDLATPLACVVGQVVVNSGVTQGANKCTSTVQSSCTSLLPASVAPIGNNCAGHAIQTLADSSKRAATPVIVACAKNSAEFAKDGCHKVIEASVQYVNKTN